MMKVDILRSFNTRLVATCVALGVTVMPQMVLSKDFAFPEYRKNGVVWEVAPPSDTEALYMRVVYTPTGVKGDSWLEQRTFKRGEPIHYPFSAELQDGTYTWEIRQIKARKAARKGDGPEGPVDENGRPTSVVGPSLTTKERTPLSNLGRDTVQQGSFVVIDGVIPDFNVTEKD